MAADRQTPCLYYVCAGLCKKGCKADHAHYCQHCSKYKPRKIFPISWGKQNIKRVLLIRIGNKTWQLQ